MNLLQLAVGHQNLRKLGLCDLRLGYLHLLHDDLLACRSLYHLGYDGCLDSRCHGHLNRLIDGLAILRDGNLYRYHGLLGRLWELHHLRLHLHGHLLASVQSDELLRLAPGGKTYLLLLGIGSGSANL